MADLSGFLRAITSGNTTFSPEMYSHFGGDDILEKLRKYDPNAQWTDVQGDGENAAMGKRLDFDVTKLPKSKRGTAGLDLNPANLHSRSLPGSTPYEDDVYGEVRNSKEFLKEKDPLWTKLAPLVVGGLGPMAGAALAGAGIGGAAGLTAGATGSGLSGSAPGWLASLVKGGPNMVGRVSQGDYSSLLSSLGGMAGNMAGIDSNYLRGAMTLAQLARQR